MERGGGAIVSNSIRYNAQYTRTSSVSSFNVSCSIFMRHNKSFCFRMLVFILWLRIFISPGSDKRLFYGGNKLKKKQKRNGWWMLYLQKKHLIIIIFTPLHAYLQQEVEHQYTLAELELLCPVDHKKDDPYDTKHHYHPSGMLHNAV